MPLGPLLTGDETERESHVRVERGTRCYQDGRCRKANSYRHDAEIAAHLDADLAGSRLLAGTSLWATVERRGIVIQCCVDADAGKAALAKIARRLPDVEQD